MDATLCLREGQHIKVGGNGAAYAGDRFLGGLDFDKALVSIAAEQLALQDHRLDPEALGSEEGQVFRIPPWLWDLVRTAEQLKWKLSSEERANWHEEIHLENSREAFLNFWVSRAEFEQRIAPLIERTLEWCDTALTKHAATRVDLEKLSTADQLRQVVRDLDEIILVGGSTRVPCIAEKLQAHYERLGGRSVTLRSFDVDTCVALGAALYAASYRARRTDTHPDQLIQWVSGPSAQVGQDIPQHPSLSGTVPMCIAADWSIEISVSGQTWKASLESNGYFTLPAFPLQSGENHLVCTVRDAHGDEQGQQSYSVKRGGWTTDVGGLARPIQARLVDGMYDLLAQGSRDGHRQRVLWYLHDDSATIRVPLYEGPYPLTVVELQVPTQPTTSLVGTAVELHTRYQPGHLEFEVQVGNLLHERRDIPCQPIGVSGTRDELVQRYGELRQRTAEALQALPETGDFTTKLRQQREALLLDLETDFATPLFDAVRIEDRLCQLEHLDFHIRTFPHTAAGLQQRIEGLRQALQERGNTQNVQLLQDLQGLDQQLSPDTNTETIAALRQRFGGILRRFLSTNPRPVTSEELGEVRIRMQERLKNIRTACREDAAVRARVDNIAQAMEALDQAAPPPAPATHYNRLWEIEFGYLNPLYHDVIIKQHHRGLLRSYA